MQIQSQEQKAPEQPQNVDRSRNYEKELADVIYMFLEEGGKGILLYDRSEDISASDLAETLKDGEFITDTVSCENVEWDDRVNIPNESLRVRYVEGSRKETTYIVSREKMIEVLSAILEANKENRSYIKLDSKERTPMNKVNAPEEYMNSDDDKKRLLEELQGKVNQIIAEKEPTNKKDSKIESVEPTVETNNVTSRQADKVLSPEESLIKMINDNRDVLLANGFTEQDIQDAISNGSTNMDDKTAQHLFLIESLKAFGVMDESKLVQLDQRIGGGYFTDGDIYGYDVTYGENQYRIVLEEKNLPPKESLEFGKTDDIEMLLKQKEMLEKFRGFDNSRTMRIKLAQVNKQIEAIQERGATKGKEVEGQTASRTVVTPKDIAEADTENKIASSEIYEANKHLYTHKEYEKYTKE